MKFFIYLILEHVLDQNLDDIQNIDHVVEAIIDGKFRIFYYKFLIKFLFRSRSRSPRRSRSTSR